MCHDNCDMNSEFSNKANLYNQSLQTFFISHIFLIWEGEDSFINKTMLFCVEKCTDVHSGVGQTKVDKT
jgi:hypothetical protein